MTGFDDEFFSAMMQDNDAGTQLLLRIVLRIPDLVVIHTSEIQATKSNLFGKSIRFDCYAESVGRRFDVEIQRRNKGADSRRARYYSSILNSNISFDGEEYDQLPDCYVIFITEKDIYKAGKPYYEIERVVKTMNEDFNDGSHIVYVNGEYKGDDDIGKLIHDLHCVDPSDMNFKPLRERASFLKNTEEGVKQMSEVVEKIVNEHKDGWYAQGKEDKANQIAMKMIQLGTYSDNEIAQLTGLSVDDVKAMKESLRS